MQKIWVGLMIGVVAVAGLAGCLVVQVFPGDPRGKLIDLTRPGSKGDMNLTTMSPHNPITFARAETSPQDPPPGPALEEWKQIWSANMAMPELVALAPPLPPPSSSTPDLLVPPPSISPHVAPPPPIPVSEADVPRASAPPVVAPSVEAKLEQMLRKLEQIEKRLDAMQKRKEEKLLRDADKMLERIEDLEKRLELESEPETAAPRVPKMGGFCTTSLLWTVLRGLENWSVNPTQREMQEQRFRQLLQDSENLRNVQEEIDTIWLKDHQRSLTPFRTSGVVGP